MQQRINTCRTGTLTLTLSHIVNLSFLLGLGQVPHVVSCQGAVQRESACSCWNLRWRKSRGKIRAWMRAEQMCGAERWVQVGFFCGALALDRWTLLR